MKWRATLLILGVTISGAFAQEESPVANEVDCQKCRTIISHLDRELNIAELRTHLEVCFFSLNELNEQKIYMNTKPRMVIVGFFFVACARIQWDFHTAIIFNLFSLYFSTPHQVKAFIKEICDDMKMDGYPRDVIQWCRQRIAPQDHTINGLVQMANNLVDAVCGLHLKVCEFVPPKEEEKKETDEEKLKRKERRKKKDAIKKQKKQSEEADPAVIEDRRAEL
jgi:hypothetical protein